MGITCSKPVADSHALESIHDNATMLEDDASSVSTTNNDDPPASTPESNNGPRKSQQDIPLMTSAIPLSPSNSVGGRSSPPPSSISSSPDVGRFRSSFLPTTESGPSGDEASTVWHSEIRLRDGNPAERDLLYSLEWSIRDGQEAHQQSIDERDHLNHLVAGLQRLYINGVAAPVNRPIPVDGEGGAVAPDNLNADLTEEKELLKTRIQQLTDIIARLAHQLERVRATRGRWRTRFNTLYDHLQQQPAVAHRPIESTTSREPLVARSASKTVPKTAGKRKRNEDHGGSTRPPAKKVQLNPPVATPTPRIRKPKKQASQGMRTRQWARETGTYVPTIASSVDTLAQHMKRKSRKTLRPRRA